MRDYRKSLLVVTLIHLQRSADYKCEVSEILTTCRRAHLLSWNIFGQNLEQSLTFFNVEDFRLNTGLISKRLANLMILA
jgi:hypothetical protein